MTESRTKKFLKGELVFKEGDHGNCFYIIKAGSVEVVKGLGESDEIVIAVLKKNEIFGEMAIFGDKTRSASIRAAEDIEVMEISENVIRAKLPSSPEWIRRMFEILVKRLKNTNEKIKARFKIGLGLSIYNLLSLILYKYGKKHPEGKLLEFDETVKRINYIIGVTRHDIDKLLEELKFINVIKYNKSRNEIIITDETRFNDFLQFASETADSKDFQPPDIDKLSEEELKKANYYKELLKILMRKYPEILVIT